MSPESSGFGGLRVLCFESRRAMEIAELVRRHGGDPLSAPSMREVPLDESSAAFELAERLIAGSVDVAVFLTGIGMKLWLEAVETKVPRGEIAAALSRIVTVARGPKPRAVLQELGLRPTVQAPEPNTWKELLAAIDASTRVAGRTVAIQEYGAENPELVDGLASRGASVLRVPIYRWALPDDLGPLRYALAELGRGAVDVALFTSATQVDHVAEVLGEPLATSFAHVAIASIGPICSAALRRHGLSPDIEPEHPKMGQLVRSAATEANGVLARKRGSR